MPMACWQHVFEYFTERTPRSHFEPRDTSLVWNYKYAGILSVWFPSFFFLIDSNPVCLTLPHVSFHVILSADVEFGRLQARDMLQHLWTGPISNASVDVVQGSRSVEVRPVGVTKVTASSPYIDFV